MNALNYLSTPLAIYIGLGLCLLFLLFASLQQKCSLKVFFLLALRLAIGWHFLFEGLHKIHSHYVGPTDSNKPFTSEPYFALADGPLGPMMRARIGDPEQLILLRIVPNANPENPKSLNDSALAKLVPNPVAQDWEQYVGKFSETYKIDANTPENKTLSEKLLANYGRWISGVEVGKDSKVRYVQTDVALTVPQRIAHIKKLEVVSAELKERIKPGLGQGYGYDIKSMTAAKNELSAARNELLADGDSVLADMKKELFAMTAGKRLAEFPTPSVGFTDETKFKELLSFSTPGGPATFETSVPPSVREHWNKYVETLQTVYPLNDADKKKVNDSADFWKQQLADWFTKEKEKDGWKKVKEAYDVAVKSEKNDAIEKAKLTMLAELDKQFAALKTSSNNMLTAETLSGVVTVAKPKPIEQIDQFTRYFIAIVGACIFFGVLTRLNCLLAVGFLVMTYLTHPPFPWLPLPPNTEGNPLFINKNIIEALALMVIVVHPTGRWLGLDALIHRVLFGRKAFVN